jgi:hypothetical protein
MKAALLTAFRTSKPTGWRGTILDLVLTKEDSLIENFEYQSPLGKSDHCVLSFDYKCSISISRQNRQRRNYSTTDFENFRKEVYTIVWEDLLRKDTGWSLESVL